MSTNSEANRSGAGNGLRYSLTQRVYLTFAEYYPQALDRGHVKMVLNLDNRALAHAMRRLADAMCVRRADGRRGFYEFVPGAKLPSDTRGKNPLSHGNRGRRAR